MVTRPDAAESVTTAHVAPVVLGNPYVADCPTRPILDRIGDRWTVLVVGILDGGDARFSVLRRRVEGVSQKMLTQTLRALERDGLVSRTVYPEVPVRVEYALTEAGKTLCAPLQALQQWAIENRPAIEQSRTDYDDRVKPSQ